MSDFVEHILELMRPWAVVTARRMFGGHGLYRDGLMFALEANDTLYLKVDAQAAPLFAAAGCAPFIYENKGRSVQLSYWTAPPECAESAAEMARWCALGWQAALRTQAAQVDTGSPRKAASRSVRKAAGKTAAAAKAGAKRAKR